MALLGQFSGDTGNRTVVDLGLGYKFNDTITFDISAQNLFDNEYRTYPLFPKIGRRVLAKLTFNFTGKE